ncbi:glycosyl transferase family protein [Oscillochloris trichoides DG-6]|uniref:Glycosyl transferase family protein n=1 Tax=Oscillochloris trichoides DG-6 TaxID=765420 RepID=E1IBL2_9CHLR|nr:glycosyltransferase [Oscillochloris trichoides]EFO81431.1 glycosyl transferase family protein [Oscillochloris trichoides DG-6]
MQVESLPKIDIIIPTRNRGHLIDVTLASIRASVGVTFNLWVIDQSDDDCTERAVAPHAAVDSRVHYIPTHTRGISAARNVGVSMSHAPYILFTDDDCRVDPGWAAAMITELLHPMVWAVFGRILPETEVDLPTHPALQGVALATKMSGSRVVYARNRFNLGFGHGASMGVRREVLEYLGGFDDLLGVGAILRSWEDRDLGFRILSAGGQIVYTPSALLYHRQWRDWHGISRAYADYGIGAGATAAKFLRYGDLGGAVLLFEWLVSQGLRQALSGVFKWHSPHKIRIGLGQLYYPWVGLWRSLRYPLSHRHRVYRKK